jgi:hypothetical protein
MSANPGYAASFLGKLSSDALDPKADSSRLAAYWEFVKNEVARGGKQAFFWRLGESLKGVGDLALASESIRCWYLEEQIARYQKRPPTVSLESLESELILERIKIPEQRIIEISSPNDVFEEIHIGAGDGLERAQYLLSGGRAEQVADRHRVESIRKWRGRLLWILGGRLGSEQMGGNAETSVTGTLLISGSPARNTRGVFLTPIEGFKSAGGWRSFLGGMEAMSVDDIKPLPRQGFFPFVTDSDGHFEVNVEAGGPYALEMFAVNRSAAVVRKVTTVVTGVGKSCLGEEGWTFPDGGKKAYNTGEVDIHIAQSGPTDGPLIDVFPYTWGGEWSRGMQASVPIRIGNVGGSPLSVAGVKTTCQCSTLTRDPGGREKVAFPHTLAPNASEVLYVQITSTYRSSLGPKSTGLIFLSDDPIAPVKEVRLAYSLKADFRLDPRIARIRVVGGNKASQIVRLKSAAGDTSVSIADVKIRQAIPWVKVRMMEDRKSFEVVVDSELFGANIAGRMKMIDISVVLDDPGQPPLRLPLFCTPGEEEGRSFAEPSHLDLGKVSKGAVLEREICLSGKTNLARVTTSGDGFRLLKYQGTPDGIELIIQIIGAASKSCVNLYCLDNEDRYLAIPVTWSLVTE